jgi:hypothetical protein
MYTAIYVYDFLVHSSKLSSQLLHAGTEELLHTTQIVYESEWHDAVPGRPWL